MKSVNTGPHATAKLTFVEAIAVRQLRRVAKVSDIAKHFGVSEATIFNIQRGITYQDAHLRTGEELALKRCLHELMRYKWVRKGATRR